MKYWLITYHDLRQDKKHNCVTSLHPADWLLAENSDEDDAVILLLFALEIDKSQYDKFNEESNSGVGFTLTKYF